ncbi:MAG: hypothetical protein K1X81_07300 [Bacteroidia bacterium]|nr:hypothetical protein [Bacteroidia bacterium]
MKKLLYIVIWFLLSAMHCVVEHIPHVRTTYYNWSNHNLYIRAFNEGKIAYEIFIIAGTNFSFKDETKAVTPLIVLIADSAVVTFEDGKKLWYADNQISPTNQNLLSIGGYDYFKSTDINNFQYAFTNEHYLKAQ